MKIFISHSSLDAWVARKISDDVRAVGAETVLDETDFAAGDDFLERILAAEPLCSELLVLLTPWSIRRPWVLFEISCFRHSRKRIIGIAHGLTTEEILRDPYVGTLLDRRVIVDINKLDGYLQELAARVRESRSGEPND